MSTPPNFTFVQFTCAPDEPCRDPERLSGGEVEGKWLHLRGVYATEWPAEPFRAAGEFQKSAADYKSIASAAFQSQAESACRQYRAVRWFLLPEAELRLRLGGRLQICNNKYSATTNIRRSRVQCKFTCDCRGATVYMAVRSNIGKKEAAGLYNLAASFMVC